jgi:hypothetical protein
MTQDEINEGFRNLIVDLAELGYKKTNIGRILFGMSAFSQVSKFVAGIDDPDQKNNFGIAPLSKIGSLIDHELHLVYVDPNDKETLDKLYEKNQEFYTELKGKIKDFLDDNIQSKKNATNDPERLNKSIDEILSLLS